jgi:pimeloyl-ACP methyl ester carboxylesterase
METPRERRLPAADGITLRALEWPGGAAPLLFVHATSFCAETWAPVWSAAAEAGAAGRRVLAVDQRGHGGSEAPAAPSDYAWTRLAADVVEIAGLVAAEAGGPIVAVGHSSGATACLAAAASRPDRFAAVIAVEPVLRDASPEARADSSDSFAGSSALAAGARRRRGVFASEEEARARLRSRFPYSGFAADAFEALLTGAFERRADGTLTLRCPGEREAWCYEGAAALDLWPLAKTIRAPLGLVLGQYSAVPTRLRERLLAGRAGTRVETIAGATHFAALERPVEVGAAIARLLAGGLR